MPRSLAVLVGYAMTALSTSVLAGDAAQPDFERDIRPIFARHCVACHGSDKQESGLRLDSPAGIRRGGDGGKVVPTERSIEDGGSNRAELSNGKGLLKQSRLFRAVTGGDDELGKMPPKGPGLKDG